MGSLIKVNNVTGTPFINIGGNETNVVELRNERKGGSPQVGSGLTIGEARVYNFGTADAAYSDATTEWDLHLYDIQTFTTLRLNTLSATKIVSLVKGTRVRGLASGAIGYLAYQANSTGANEITLSQTTGTFINGEQLIFNERASEESASITKIIQYTTDDIKSIRQSKFSVGISTFNADTVLYDRILPNFSLTDSVNIVGTAASVPNRSFAGVGINTGAILAYNKGDYQDVVYNKIDNISPNGKVLTLAATSPVVGVNTGTVTATTSTFRIKVPRVLNLNKSGIFAKLPRQIISDVNTSNSNLVITRQIVNQSVSSGSLSLNSQAGLDASVGITSVFFEPFDSEKYSITYQDGTIEKLTSDQVTISNDGNDISFSGLKETTASEVTVTATLKKVGASSKTKDYVRSKTIEVTRTSGVNTLNGLTQHDGYGLRVEDKEISLNVPDVSKILGVYESKTNAVAVLDKLKFVSGLDLNTNAIVGEKIVGKDSRAIGQIVNRPNATEIEFVYLNANKFTIGEVINFKESSIETILQGLEVGNFIDRTDNYVLDKGHKEQYCDYSKIVRKAKSAIPSKKLLIIFDQYQVASGNTGDFFSVNSFTKDRYSRDIPSIGSLRVTDILDFRPRVNPFTIGSSAASPFAFSSRTFESTNPFVITPNESSILGYSYYLPRVDKLVINKYEK
ncbi:MAG: hypothetical protein CM15mP113_1450 [Pseudomonadota bacterium]|nr:MAG: hypothetical protein CM15mP113_1450 [Pseudomonadota bacterium]